MVLPEVRLRQLAIAAANGASPARKAIVADLPTALHRGVTEIDVKMRVAMVLPADRLLVDLGRKAPSGADRGKTVLTASEDSAGHSGREPTVKVHAGRVQMVLHREHGASVPGPMVKVPADRNPSADRAQANQAQMDVAQMDVAQMDVAQMDVAQMDVAQTDEAQTDEVQTDEAQTDGAQTDEAQTDRAQADRRRAADQANRVVPRAEMVPSDRSPNAVRPTTLLNLPKPIRPRRKAIVFLKTVTDCQASDRLGKSVTVFSFFPARFRGQRQLSLRLPCDIQNKRP
jgi:hypothetical protein